MWSKIYTQLPRLGLQLKHRAMVIKATVVASLLYGCEARSFTPKQFREYGTSLNKIVLGLLNHRRRDMPKDQVTMFDLRAQLGLDSVRILVGQRQLSYLGHLGRMPDSWLEKKALWLWLTPESDLTTRKGGRKEHTRAQLWKRPEELLAFSDVAPGDYVKR